MKHHTSKWMVALAAVASAPAASAVYLYEANMDVFLGASMSAEPFVNRTTAESLTNMINLTDPTQLEYHDQPSHVWVSPQPLETDFDLLADYDLTTLHFWNYYGEGYDVDNIDLRFYDSSNNLIATQLGITPALGASQPIPAEDIPLTAAAQGVRYINAVFTGSNNQVDFNNIGFTGELAVPILPGDMNGDGTVDNADISGFVLALTNPAQYASEYPALDANIRGDFTGDDLLTNADITDFVNLFTAADSAALPEPGSLALLGLGGIVLARRRR